MWGSRYFGGNEPLSTTGKAERDLVLRIDDDLRDRLAKAPPPPLPEEASKAMEAVLARYAS